MTSSSGKQIIAKHILSYISISEGTQAMKFVQLLEYNLRNIFLQTSFKNEVDRKALDLFLIFDFLKDLHEVTASSQHLSFNFFW